jgi:hypothetical protein
VLDPEQTIWIHNTANNLPLHLRSVGATVLHVKVDWVVKKPLIGLDHPLGGLRRPVGQQLSAGALLECTSDGSLGVGSPQRLPRFRTSDILHRPEGSGDLVQRRQTVKSTKKNTLIKQESILTRQKSWLSLSPNSFHVSLLRFPLMKAVMRIRNRRNSMIFSQKKPKLYPCFIGSSSGLGSDSCHENCFIFTVNMWLQNE